MGIDMNSGDTGYGAARMFTGGGGCVPPGADGGEMHTAKAPPSTRYSPSGGGGGDGGFFLNGPTPSPAEATAFAKAALAASYWSILPGDMGHGGHEGSHDPRQPERHAVYAYAAASSSWTANCDLNPRPHNDPRQAIGQGLQGNREEEWVEAAGHDGGSTGARGHGDGAPKKRKAMMDALELELLERAKRAHSMRRAKAPPLPKTHGLVFPPLRCDLTHLLQDSSRTDEAMQSISTNPGAHPRAPNDCPTELIAAIHRSRRGDSAQPETTVVPAKQPKEHYHHHHHHPDEKEPPGMIQEPSCSRAKGKSRPTIPKTGNGNEGIRCQHPDCTRVPTFGPKEGKRRRVYCATHKHEGMTRVVSRQCTEDMCSTAPSYGFQGKKASFCSKHKMPGMVNVVSPRCQERGCASCASYGHLRDRRPLFCVRHAHDGMSNVVSRKCLRVGCAKHPSYGHPGDRRASFCADHHLPGMSNIVSRKCLAPGCGKAPSFGENGDRKASWCKSHKQGGMVNVLYSRQSTKAG